MSDGELRQPGQDIMRKLAGAKDKLGLRVHGLIVGSPEKKRADPAVLRALCRRVLETYQALNPDPELPHRGHAHTACSALCRHMLSLVHRITNRHVLPSGKNETLVTEFDSWASVAEAGDAMRFDWDDSAGNAARREAGLKLEAMRKVMALPRPHTLPWLGWRSSAQALPPTPYALPANTLHPLHQAETKRLRLEQRDAGYKAPLSATGYKAEPKKKKKKPVSSGTGSAAEPPTAAATAPSSGGSRAGFDEQKGGCDFATPPPTQG